MSSIMSSRYWTCPSCCSQFDWESKTSNPRDHDSIKCREEREKSSAPTLPAQPKPTEKKP